MSILSNSSRSPIVLKTWKFPDGVVQTTSVVVEITIGTKNNFSFCFVWRIILYEQRRRQGFAVVRCRSVLCPKYKAPVLRFSTYVYLRFNLRTESEGFACVNALSWTMYKLQCFYKDFTRVSNSDVSYPFWPNIFVEEMFQSPSNIHSNKNVGPKIKSGDKQSNILARNKVEKMLASNQFDLDRGFNDVRPWSERDVYKYWICVFCSGNQPIDKKTSSHVSLAVENKCSPLVTYSSISCVSFSPSKLLKSVRNKHQVIWIRLILILCVCK